MPAQRRNRTLEFGVMLLLMELFQFGLTNIPPVTLVAILGQIGLYTGILSVSWDKWDVCLNAKSIMKHKEYRRLFLSAVEHGDDMHLYYNMLSLLIKGRSLERKMGSKNFALLLFILTLLTSCIYVGLAWASSTFTNDYVHMKTCAIGFSGVLFAMKVLTSEDQSTSMKYAVWSELILIYLLVPGSSFMGHLAGILAGLVYSKTRIGSFIKKIMVAITGESLTSGANRQNANNYYNHNQHPYNPYYNDDSNNQHYPPGRGGYQHGNNFFGGGGFFNNNFMRRTPNYGWNIG